VTPVACPPFEYGLPLNVREHVEGTTSKVTMYPLDVAEYVPVTVPLPETVMLVEAEVVEVTVPAELLQELNVSPVHVLAWRG